MSQGTYCVERLWLKQLRELIGKEEKKGFFIELKSTNE
jgi:hypothetical protein